MLRGKSGGNSPPEGDDESPARELSPTPLPPHPNPGSYILSRGADDISGFSADILVSAAGDARANGVYRRCGAQNDAPRWRHVERTWLCILRDGSSWWIGNEKAAREDLYWCDATLPGQEREEPALRTKKGWRVCACDDRTHKHFRGCEPTPELSWVDPRAPAPKPPAPATYDTEECPICLCAPGDEAARMPCGHVACALCLSRAKAMSPKHGAEDCARCPLCRCPFALEGATLLASGAPLLEALPDVGKAGEKPVVSESRPRRRSFSNPLSPTTRATQNRRPLPDASQPTRQRSNSGLSLRARLLGLFR